MIERWWFGFKMMKLLIYLSLWSVSNATAAYFSRMAAINHMSALNAYNRRPTAFRPGVMLHRPWMSQRLVQAASYRAPYVIYRNNPHRYAVKHYSSRPTFSNAWKTTRVPAATSEYEFIRAASASPQLHSQVDGAIHTIPAPNLSLSEKPIIVMETDNIITTPTSEAPKSPYEVTEKTPDPLTQVSAKIEQPIGFSKATSLTTPEVQHLVRNGATLQLASDLGLSAIALPHVLQTPAFAPQPFHQTIVHQPSIVQHPILPHRSIIPQQFALQNLSPNPQEILHAGPDGLIITPNALYQPDPAFIQKLQNQLMQRFPGVEFVPYAADIQPIPFHSQVQKHPQPEIQTQVPQIQIELQTDASQTQEPIFLLQNEQITKQTPSSFVPSENKIVQRETQEGTIVTLTPQVIIGNVTDNQIKVTSLEPQNISFELIAAESQPSTTTVKYVVESNTEEQKTTPVFYAQLGQNAGNIVTDGLYSAINEIRAAAALAQVEKPLEQHIHTNISNSQENITTTTLNPDLKPYFVPNTEANDLNQTANEIKPLLGVPFAKSPDSVNVGYTLLSANVKTDDNKHVKVAKDGSVYAGQIVEATITEDHDFNREKAALMQRRAPIRLIVTDKKEASTTTTNPPKITQMIRTRIPLLPKSKLTVDDKTGEPVLRIYASYVDTPLQKDLTASKVASANQVKEAFTRKQDTVDNWKSANAKALDKSKGFDLNQVTQFGLKLRERSDDYVPLFGEYED
ncbi:uncharacterized protein LOC113231606 isoform X2 [Hyposmocoma kahamanoa]|uniref:uncharacterized protein LOC113231606 isoform X2 n=1 Tax=Hyposmocoma kahamanoa TaxID=1477025 RepID=UPI000E6D8E6C|nr:uncharacterized protein LOC113231606 isoform X2 [Hyposmocoma kahamanoa]